MRFPPALIILTLLVVVVVGGSAVAHRTSGTAGASPGADNDAATQATDAATPVKPVREVPELTLPDPLPVRTVDVPILMYHRIAVLHGDEVGTELDLTVDPQEFTLQMQWLADNGYRTIGQLDLYRALMEGAPLPDKPVLITFDDGYRGIATIAAPIMQRYGFVGTAYVITDRVVRDPRKGRQWLTRGELRVLEQRGWDIGSHTMSHREVPGLDAAGRDRELVASRRTLQRILGHPVQWFCYPAGRVDPGAVQAVRDAGYVLATTTQSGTTLNAQDPLRLPRVRVSNTTGVRGLAAALS